MRDWILRVFFGLRKQSIEFPSYGYMTISGPLRIEGYNVTMKGS